MNCKYCRANCTGAKHDREIALCLGYDPPKTNGDFIRSMSDEELAKAVYMGCPEGKSISYCLGVLMREPSSEECQKCWLDWLKQERE